MRNKPIAVIIGTKRVAPASINATTTSGGKPRCPSSVFSTENRIPKDVVEDHWIARPELPHPKG